MLYRHQPAPPQVRLRCRNPGCGATLKIPAANPRDAFCCKGCEGRFYSCRCRVCEQLFSRKTSRRQVYRREQCRYALKANPRQFFLPLHNHAKQQNRSQRVHKPYKNRVESDANPGRGWRIIAGQPDFHPINLHSFSADPALSWTGRRGPVLFTRTTPPVSIGGGHKFPSAPIVDLTSTLADRLPA